jgi:hypothetical protein
MAGMAAVEVEGLKRLDAGAVAAGVEVGHDPAKEILFHNAHARRAGRVGFRRPRPTLRVSLDPVDPHVDVVAVAQAAALASSVTSIPSPPHVTILLALKLRQPISASAPTGQFGNHSPAHRVDVGSRERGLSNQQDPHHQQPESDDRWTDDGQDPGRAGGLAHIRLIRPAPIDPSPARKTTHPSHRG